MNTSVAIFSENNEEETIDVSSRKGSIAKLLEAVDSILTSKGWSTLKAEFYEERQRLNRVLLAEAKKQEPSLPEMYRLQGRLDAMQRFDLDHMKEKLLKEFDSLQKNRPSPR